MVSNTMAGFFTCCFCNSDIGKMENTMKVRSVPQERKLYWGVHVKKKSKCEIEIKDLGYLISESEFISRMGKF